MIDDIRSQLSEAALRCYYAVAGAISFGDDVMAGRFFIESWRTVTKEERNKLRDLINERLLCGFEKEVSAHGIRRSFKFWSIEEKAALIEFASEVICLLKEKTGGDACIGYGTALAVARSNDLIPHDDDVDLICVLSSEKYSTFNSAIRSIKLSITDRDIKIHGDQAAHCKFNRGKYTIDVFVALQEGDFISSIPGPRKMLLKSDVFPSRKVDLFGVHISAPRDFDAYLSKIYGETWRIPDPVFGHNWNTEPFADLIESV